MWGWIKRFFLATETPRIWLIVGGIFVLGAPMVYDHFASQQERQQEIADEAAEKLYSRANQLQAQSVDFQTYAAAFVSSLLDGSADVDVQRQRLIENIVAQDAAVDVSRRVIGDEGAVKAYRKALQSVKIATEKAHDVNSLSPFWKATSDFLVERNALQDSLERRAEQSG